MAKNSNQYDREYKKAMYDMEIGKRDSMIDTIHEIKFGNKQYNITQFKNLYKDRVTSKEQEFALNTCLDLLSMINSAKLCLLEEGAYTKNATGALKVNPAQRELRDSLKAFNTQLEILNSLIVVDEEEDLSGWLDD